MRKNKYFIKRKNSFSGITSTKVAFSALKYTLLVFGTLGWAWIMICLLGAIVHA